VLSDEPFSGLDPINVRRIEALLVDLNRRLGLTMIITSHHLASSLRMADRIVFLVDGRAIAGTPQDLLHSNGTQTFLVMVVTMTAGTAVIMWLGELITDRGVGNGMSIMIFTQVVASFPAALWAVPKQKRWWVSGPVGPIGLAILPAAHLTGPNAPEPRAEAGVAMALEPTADELGRVFHAHPTVSESIMEAAEGVHDLTIHM